MSEITHLRVVEGPDRHRRYALFRTWSTRSTSAPATWAAARRVFDALRAELSRRPAPDPNGPQPAAGAHALPREARSGDNNPPTDVNPLEERLNEAHRSLVDQAAELEITAASLPREVTSEEDVALLNAWILKAQTVGRTAEKHRKDEKEPFLRAGKVVDGFFNGIADGLARRVKGLEDRKVPFLRAKRAREEADRAASAAALRRSQQEAADRVEQERQEAQRKRDEAERLLGELRAATDPEVIERLEGAYRAAARDAQLSDAAADQAVKDARKVEKAAVREERILAGDHRHVLGKVQEGGGSSSLRTSWKPEVHNAQRLMASLGPLAPFLGDQAVDAALARAAKAEVRPAIPGVDFVEDFQSQTRASR
jgi:hypothetical protein